MQQFKYFENKTTLLMKKFVASNQDLGRIKIPVTKFMKYMTTDFEKNLDLFKLSVNVDSIQLEQIINAKYKFLVKGTELKSYVAFLQDLEKRASEFEKKELNLRVLFGVYFVYYVLIVRLVETYLGAVTSYSVSDPNSVDYKLSDIGIDNNILKHFALFEDLRSKTIDEWLKVDITALEEKYFMSAIKRILIILGES